MTNMPKTIGEDIPISIAKEVMKRGEFRHLPVLSAGRLVGVVSDRDISVAESFSGKGEITIGDIMTPDPYVASQDEPVDHVLLHMAEKRYGCALVRDAESEALIGIFTDTDALRFYADRLQQDAGKKAA